MVGKLDVRYNLPENAKLKSRFATPEGVDFTKALRKAIELAVIELLNTNQLNVRTLIEKNLKAQGLEVKKEAYQRNIDNDNKSMLRCSFGTKENMPAEETPVVGDAPTKDEPEVAHDNAGEVCDAPAEEEAPKVADPDLE